MKHACEGLQPERNSRPTHSSEDGKGVAQKAEVQP